MSENDSVVAARRCYALLGDVHAVAAIISTPAKQITTRQVRAWVGNFKDPTKDHEARRYYPRHTRSRAVEMYVEDEMSMAAVARKIGCTATSVRTWLLEADVQFRTAQSILTVRSGLFKRLFAIPLKRPKGRHLRAVA